MYATDGGAEYPIHGAIWDGDSWISDTWGPNGKYIGAGVKSGNDLMPPEPELQRFLLWTTPMIGQETTTVLEIEIQPDCTLKVVR